MKFCWSFCLMLCQEIRIFVKASPWSWLLKLFFLLYFWISFMFSENLNLSLGPNGPKTPKWNLRLLWIPIVKSMLMDSSKDISKCQRRYFALILDLFHMWKFSSSLYFWWFTLKMGVKIYQIMTPCLRIEALLRFWIIYSGIIY